MGVNVVEHGLIGVEQAYVLLQLASHFTFFILQISLTLLFQSYTHFFTNTLTFIYFYLVLYFQLVGSKGAQKIWFASHLNFLHSKLVFHSFESLFLRIHINLYISLFGLVPLPGRILRGSENTTGQSYSLHIQSTLPKFYNGLLYILLFSITTQSYAPWNHLNFIWYLQLVRSLKAYQKIQEVQLAYLIDFAQFL